MGKRARNFRTRLGVQDLAENSSIKDEAIYTILKRQSELMRTKEATTTPTGRYQCSD